MNDLQRLRDWLYTWPGASAAQEMRVDYVDRLPGGAGAFPCGLEETGGQEDILGDRRVECRYHFALYLTLKKAADGAQGATPPEQVLDLQKWIGAQSLAGLAPTFGDIERGREAVAAQNGVSCSGADEGTETYMMELTARFVRFYPAS